MTKSNAGTNGGTAPIVSKNLVIWLIAGAAGLLFLILLVVAVSRPATPLVVSATPVDESMPVLDGAQTERRALAKAELQRLQQEGELVRRTLAECEQEIAAWDREVEPALTGNNGQAVAADRESLERFHAVYHQPRIAKSELDACRERLDTILQPVAAALASGTLYVPSSEASAKLSAERKFSETARQSLHEAVRNAVAVIADAQRKATTGDRPLQDAMKELDAQRDQARVAVIAAREESAREQATKQIADARAAQARAYGEAEAARIEEETRREIERKKAEDAIKAQSNTRAILEQRAADPVVQSKYKPFLGKGKFGSDTNVPGLLSFNYMNRIGVLSDVKCFVNAGCGRRIGVDSGHNAAFTRNDREHWTFPVTEEDWNEYRRRFEEFRELAPLFIELKLLRE